MKEEKPAALVTGSSGGIGRSAVPALARAGYNAADIEPRIWRRFPISADVTFRDLHDAVQVS